MFDLNKLIRPNILTLQSYASARDEYQSEEGIFLDANENPYGQYNRYPDPYQRLLKDRLADLKGINPKNIFIGNGSDEVIDLTFRIFCKPSQDQALTFAPSYGMYDVSAAIHDVALIKISLDKNFQIDISKLENHLYNTKTKLLFICSPNNPTGNIMNENAIRFILENFQGIVIIDEAYADFCDAPSWLNEIENYPNLIVCQTFSKAWGLAAVRVGVAYTNQAILSYLNKVKAPYNVSQVNQMVALEALENVALFEKQKHIILQERSRLRQALEALDIIKKIYPSAANFLLLEVTDSDTIYKKLIQQKIIVRNRNKQVKNCIRISIGTPEENNQLINALKQIKYEESTIYR